MEHRLDRMEEKLDKISTATIENTASLKEHMTQTLEVRKQTEILTKLYEESKVETEKRLKPLETFKDRCIFSCHIVAYVATAIYGAKELGLLDFLLSIYKGH
jgi:hypothetical protein